MSKETKPFQEVLAAWVVVSGIVVCGLCAVTAIISSAKFPATAAEAKNILTILLPMVGTWVGTVLAFYFGRDNFEAGARETRLSLGQKLSAKAKDIAMPLAQIKSMDVTDDAAAKALTLAKISDHLTSIGFARTPIFTAGKIPLYVVHRQPLDTFVAAQARAGNAAIPGLTLADLLNSAEGQVVKDSFATVQELATLAEAKAAMEARKGCQDVFITRDGQATSPVIAWLTNNSVQRAATG